jgi:hypothetical protein
MVHTTLREPSEQLNPAHDRAPGRSLRDLALEIEDLWGRTLRERPKGMTIDTPKQSLLRVAHFAVAAAADLEEMGSFR